jgi:teichuronic acid biosynthesis glycosyltransferase TuaG
LLEQMPKVKAPVSVVIPCYCSSSTVERAVASVLAQSLPAAEIIMVDDASPDNTLGVLTSIQSRYGSNLIQIVGAEKNVGAGEARNLGWATASQPWIAFLDADDAWHPRKLEIQYGWVARHPETILCAHETVVAGSLDWPINKDIVARRIDPRKLPYSNVVPTRSVMLKKNIPYRFPAGKRNSEDFALWLQIVLSGSASYKLQVPLACTFRPEYSGSGLSARLWLQEKGELETLRTVRRAKLIGINTLVFSSIWSLLKFVKRILRRKILRRAAHF